MMYLTVFLFHIKKIQSVTFRVAVGISYIGELGWKYTHLLSMGYHYGMNFEKPQEFNMICSGAGAFESLRLEKGYRSWVQIFILITLMSQA